MKKREPIFIWSDFNHTLSHQEIADIANAKIEKLISDSPRVYFYQESASDSKLGVFKTQYDYHTHTAVLFDIQEIQRECVEHEPSYALSNGQEYTECKHCGKKIVAKWEVAK